MADSVEEAVDFEFFFFTCDGVFDSERLEEFAVAETFESDGVPEDGLDVTFRMNS